MSTEGWKLITPPELASLMEEDKQRKLLIDSRSFLEFNTCHVRGAINVSFSKLIKRSLQSHQLPVKQLLALSHDQLNFDLGYDVIVVYDQCTSNPQLLTEDSFLGVLLQKLVAEFVDVRLLMGGLIDFQAEFHTLCETQRSLLSFPSSSLSASSSLSLSSSSSSSSTYGRQKCMLSLSHPCMSFSGIGPTKILPFLFLGSQQDALSQEIMKQNGISYVLNVSSNGEEPEFLGEGHFLRIPVNDSHNDKLIPYFSTASQFIDKVREASGCVLVHCLAGISRSPTLAIAYLMKHLGLTCDEAYKYVKDKRPSISPNFNFLGQLLEYEKSLRPRSGFEGFSDSSIDVESSYEERVTLRSFKVLDTHIVCDKMIDFCAEEVVKRDAENIHENKFEATEESMTYNVENRVNSTMIETSSATLNISPPRPSTLLHSTADTLPKLTFTASSASLARIKPSPILEVPSPHETVRQKNIYSIDDSLAQSRELKCTSSQCDAAISSSQSTEMGNTPTSTKEPIPVGLTFSKSHGNVKDLDNVQRHHNFINASHNSHAAHHFHHPINQREYVQHCNHTRHIHRLKSHQQRFNRRFNHSSKNHLEYYQNYEQPSFHQPLYGFHVRQNPLYPYRFPPGGASHQCFPRFHSTPPMYLQHPCSQSGYIYLPNYPNYFTNRYFHRNINIHHYPNNLYGSHHHQQQHLQHSFFASNNNNSFYHFPHMRNFVFREDFSDSCSASFPNCTSFPHSGTFQHQSHFTDRTDNLPPRTERTYSHTNDPSNGFVFNNNFSQKDLGITRRLTCAPTSSKNDGENLSGNVSHESTVKYCSTAFEASSKEIDITMVTNQHGFDQQSATLPSSVVEGAGGLSESSNKTDGHPYSLKKAPLQLRPNSIALQNIKLKSSLTGSSLDSSCLCFETSLSRRDASTKNMLSNTEIEILKEQLDDFEDLVNVMDGDRISEKSERSKSRHVEDVVIKFCRDTQEMFSPVERRVHSLTDGNETLCSSLISLSSNIRPLPAAVNSFREALSSSASSSSSSSSSSRKSRSLEDIIHPSRVLQSVKDTCIHIKKLNKSSSNEKCPCKSSEKPSPIPSINETYSHKNDVDPKKQFQLLEMLNASHRWQPNEDRLEAGGMPSNGGSQNSIHGNIEVVEVS